jgi:hypothetical protein
MWRNLLRRVRRHDRRDLRFPGVHPAALALLARKSRLSAATRRPQGDTDGKDDAASSGKWRVRVVRGPAASNDGGLPDAYASTGIGELRFCCFARRRQCSAHLTALYAPARSNISLAGDR